MLDREEAKKLIDDPLYIRIDDIKGQKFFLQPSSLELHITCPRIFQIRGGFLCEELGMLSPMPFGEYYSPYIQELGKR